MTEMPMVITMEVQGGKAFTVAIAGWIRKLFILAVEVQWSLICRD